MGIQGLTHHMQPHGTKVVLSHQTDIAEPDSAVIDGPSLAYHCYYVCLSRRAGARNAVEAIPPYRELCETTLLWLEQLEQYGLEVKAIFFDGLLPASKENVRLSRLQNYANQLVTFKAGNREDLPSRPSSVRQHHTDIFSPVVSSSRLKALPAPPFLVPCIIEAIMSSSYRSVASVIPGEADAYCAQAARSLGGIIFTSDSDLLVHDLEPDGRVILFRDLETIHLPSKGKCLKAQQYHPAAIASKFGLPNLVTLAFHMSEDNHRGFTDAVRLAKEQHPTAAEFKAFETQYRSLPQLSQLKLDQVPGEVAEMLKRLDPRISELLHRITVDTGLSSSMTTPQPRSLSMYLPFIIDDPTRTSAWRAGASVRTLAYSLLRLIEYDISTIDEHERKGTRIAATPTALLSMQDIEQSLKQFTESIHSSAARHTDLTLLGQWRAFGVRLVCEASIESEKQPPSTAELSRLVTGKYEGAMTWSYIHAAAQVQAALYSIRILAQLLPIVLGILEAVNHSLDIIPALREASTVLENLPMLSELLDDGAVVMTAQEEHAKNAVQAIFDTLGVSERKSEESTTKRKKKRKKKGEHAQERSAPDTTWSKGNIFGSLA